MFLYATLTDGPDAADVARRALSGNVLLCSQQLFRVAPATTRFLRITITQPRDLRMSAAVERAIRG